MNIIKCYTVNISSYEFDELNGCETYRFKEKNIADEFCRLKFEEYSSNEELYYKDGRFIDGVYKWSYEISGAVEGIVIYDNVSEIEGGIL